MTTTSKLVFILSVFSALLFLIDPWGSQALMTILTKASVCLFLILMTWSVTGGKSGKLLMLALLFSMAGDIFLAVDRQNLFVFGLASFLLGHLTYTVVFLRHRQPDALGGFAKFIVAGLIGFTILMSILLWPALGVLKIPVILYIVAITIMGITACTSKFDPRFVIFGALSFIFSDSIIAIDKFLYPFDMSGPVIWITYVLGQYGLCLGILNVGRKNA